MFNEIVICCSDKSQAVSSPDSRYERFSQRITTVAVRNGCCKCFVNSLEELNERLLKHN